MPIGDSHEPSNGWKTQDEEEGTVQVKTEPEEFAARFRSKERQNTFVAWSAVVVISAVSIAALHNFYTAEQPWIRLSRAWMLAVISYIFATEFQRRGMKGSDQPRVRFLERQHQEQAKSYLRFRRIVPLLMTVQQSLLRHADIATTMNVYGKAVPESTRQANSKVVTMVMPKVVNAPNPGNGSAQESVEMLNQLKLLKEWRARRDSNPRPIGSKPIALSN
jgi:hypothetical protein